MGRWMEPPSFPSHQCSGTPSNRWLGGVGGSLAAVPTLFPGARPPTPPPPLPGEGGQTVYLEVLGFRLLLK